MDDITETKMDVYTPEVQAANRKLWTDALRSGEYQQGQSYLHKKENDQHYYCCLGVACEVAIKHGLKLDRDLFNRGNTKGEVYRYNTAASYLPWQVMHWLGLSSVDGEFIKPVKDASCLASANDSGMSFSEIADLIDNKVVGIKRF